MAGEWADKLYAALFEGGSSEGGLRRFYIQKGFHVFLFATMGWLGAYAGVFRSTSAAVAACSLLALSAEGLQAFFPERSPYLRDAAINLVAAWAALGWHYRLARR